LSSEPCAILAAGPQHTGDDSPYVNRIGDTGVNGSGTASFLPLWTAGNVAACQIAHNSMPSINSGTIAAQESGGRTEAEAGSSTSEGNRVSCLGVCRPEARRSKDE